MCIEQIKNGHMHHVRLKLRVKTNFSCSGTQYSLLETPNNLRDSVFTLILSENEQSRIRHIYKTHLGCFAFPITAPLHQQHLPGGPEMEKYRTEMEKYRTGDMQGAGAAQSIHSTPRAACSPSALVGYSTKLVKLGCRRGKMGIQRIRNGDFWEADGRESV